MDYNFKEPPKIKSTNAEDLIGKELAGLMGKLHAKELCSLYLAVDYLKIYPLRKCVAAMIACRIYALQARENSFLLKASMN